MELKYQLPSDPSVYVDLFNDEDVHLMFDEVRPTAWRSPGKTHVACLEPPGMCPVSTGHCCMNAVEWYDAVTSRDSACSNDTRRHVVPPA